MQRKIIAITGGFLLVLGGALAIRFSREYFARLILGAASKAVTAHPIAQRYSNIALFAPNGMKQEKQLSIDGDVARALDSVVRAWLSYIATEGVLAAPVQLEMVSVIDHGHVAVLSFSHSPLDPSWSVRQKWQCIEALFTTIKGAQLQVHSVQLLVNHAVMGDDHLDFSTPWTIEGYL